MIHLHINLWTSYTSYMGVHAHTHTQIYFITLVNIILNYIMASNPFGI